MQCCWLAAPALADPELEHGVRGPVNDVRRALPFLAAISVDPALRVALQSGTWGEIKNGE
ncbi:MAG: hypothetical protein ACJAVZ_002098 [Afipia broomeae]